MNPIAPPTPAESMEPEVVFDENDGMHVGGDYVVLHVKGVAS